ncbi:MAG TPA: hypothetical protein VGH74_18665 [Planctomycetaceae bacterium]
MNAFFDELKCGNPRKLVENVKFCEKEFPKLGDDCLGKECAEESRPFCFQMCISDCAQMIYRWHFGFRGKLPPQKRSGLRTRLDRSVIRAAHRRAAGDAPVARNDLNAMSGCSSESMAM